MKKLISLYYLAVMACAAFLASCSSSRHIVPLPEFQAAMDSIGKANNVNIWVAPNQYKTFRTSRESFNAHKQRLDRICKDTSLVYVLTMIYEDHYSISRVNGTPEDAAAQYAATERMRKDKKNRVTWEEYKTYCKDNPDFVELPKYRWKEHKRWFDKRQLTHDEFRKIKEEAKALSHIDGTFRMEKTADGSWLSERVNDTAEIARMEAVKKRVRYIGSNNMLGISPELKHLRSAVFGAEGFALSDTESLFFHVHCRNCWPLPADSIRYEIKGIFKDSKPNITAKRKDGKAVVTDIVLRNTSFNLLGNDPFRYTFTATFLYNKRWYYIFMCENPDKCICRPI